MFTGLVETMGTVRELRAEGAGRVLTVEEPALAPQLPLGASVAINGCCLTVVAVDKSTFTFQVGPETLRCTNLGELAVGERVNLERALALSDRLGGHLVQGHVDGMGRIRRREVQGDWEMFWFDCAAELTRTMVPKGSIAVDGVSLTLVDVVSDGFSVALIPHTLAVTTLGRKQAGAVVNLETDLIGKYVYKFTSMR
jgi:riboflavin synthase